MRIITGLRRGMKFESPKDQNTRPTSDMVREAIFNVLGPAIEGADVADLFAGSGALGLEALSRGARTAVMVESRRGNVELIKRNIQTLRFEDRASVVSLDVYRWFKGYTPEPGRHAVVFLDPPYAEYDHHPDRMKTLLATLWERIPPGSILVAESGRELEVGLLPDPSAADARHYGGTHVTFLEKPEPEDDRES